MKQDKIAILIPSKDRLEDLKILLQSWKETTVGLSDLIVGVDIDDHNYDELKSELLIEEYQPQPFLRILNEMAVKHAPNYKYLCFMEDDCRFITPNWEETFINAMKEIGDYAIVWGEDLVNHDRLVGIPFMDSKIVDVLGFMSPPSLKCLWVDYFWKRVGQDLGTLRYHPHITVEHRHYSTGKREKDGVSEVVDNTGHEDYITYNQHYIPHQYKHDLQKLIDARS